MKPGNQLYINSAGLFGLLTAIVALLVCQMWIDAVALAIFAAVGCGWIWLKPAVLAEKADSLKESFSDAFDIAIVFLILIVFGLYVVARALWCVVDASTGCFSVFAALLWSLACLIGGAALGFLFGVPKVVQAVGQPVAKPSTEAGADQNAVSSLGAGYQQRVNSNLEDISDWLTKIIVGVSLVEAARVVAYFKAAAAGIGRSLDGLPDDGRGFGAGIIIFFATTGFLACYLLTRLFLAGALFRAERGGGSSAEVRAKVTPVDSASLDRATRISLDEASRTLRQAGETKPATPEQAGADARVQEVAARLVEKNNPATLKTAADFTAYAKAKFIRGEFDDAVSAYDAAIRLAPDDPELRLNYAVTLYRQKPDRPIQELQNQLIQAYRLITPQTSHNLVTRIYRDLMFNLLYDTNNRGYEKAIIRGEEYVDPNRGYPRDASIWLYLACGYGQKYQELQQGLTGSPGAETPEMKRAWSRAAECVKSCLDPDSSKRELVEMLLEGKTEDNDLKLFNTDEFRVAAGLM